MDKNIHVLSIDVVNRIKSLLSEMKVYTPPPLTTFDLPIWVDHDHYYHRL